MATQQERAKTFAELHVKGNPLILYNIWDAGSAQALSETGVKAIATGSASVAAAHGYTDAESLPLELAIANIRRVVAAVDLPVTLDFESGYAREPEALKANIAQVIDAGAVGINFEDQIIGGDGLYSIEEQSARIAAIRQAADDAGVNLFINARTDIFLKTPPADHAESHVEAALERARAYQAAGGSGFFVPGLRKADLIQRVCEGSPLPVNVMYLPDAPAPVELAKLGVARVSYGPFPYRWMMEALKSGARDVLATLSGG